MKYIYIFLLATACTAVPKKEKQPEQEPAQPVVTDRESDYMLNPYAMYMPAMVVIGGLGYIYYKEKVTDARKH